MILETGYLLCDMLSSINDSKSFVLFCYLFRIKICSRFKSKSKQILEVGTCASSNLLQSAIELNANPVSCPLGLKSASR